MRGLYQNNVTRFRDQVGAAPMGGLLFGSGNPLLPVMLKSIQQWAKANPEAAKVAVANARKMPPADPASSDSQDMMKFLLLGPIGDRIMSGVNFDDLVTVFGGPIADQLNKKAHSISTATLAIVGVIGVAVIGGIYFAVKHDAPALVVSRVRGAFGGAGK